ncbi:SDR family NAD(P)-dependent oxidoreductase [Archangium violaceum]|uniref:SDR family NAD(P)-dependent oxidoreductase n=1 Tax=Archangium violaceum TaxID=83451 RepID=UPI0036DDE661
MSDRTDPALDRLDPLQRAAYTIKRMRAELDARERERSEPIAIVGIGCRFPGAPEPDAYARLLDEGRDATREVPADRWDVDAYYDPDPDAPGKIYTRRGGFLDSVDGFDPAFFGISPREARAMDPQQRLLLEVCWEALEHAGLAPSRLRERHVGVFVGIGQNDYARIKLLRGDSHLDLHDGTGNGLSFAAGRISYVLGLRGPCLAVDTACSSSLVAVHLACQSLRNRECDTALAGGVQLSLLPETSVFLARARALAPDGRCKAFDASADGFSRGEGCGVLVLRRLSDAQAAGDRIIALVRASVVNHDGPSSAFTVPSQAAQVQLLRDALAAGRLGVDDIDYLEAHGTGTRLGDPIELGALAEVFAGRGSPLPIGSVKTNFGHLEAAAGVAGLIKVALSLNQDAIPPQLHFRNPTPLVDWSRLPLEVVAARRAWPRLERPRRAGVSSFGMSGTNAHVIVEQPPAAPARVHAEPLAPAPRILTVSARAPEALVELAHAHARGLRTLEDAAQLADWCDTANVGRDHGSSRLAVIGGSPAALADALEAFAANGRGRPGELEAAHLDIPRPPELVFMFTGQGAAWPGMGQALYRRFPRFRAALERCAAVLDPLLERPLIAGLLETDASRSPLAGTAFAQPAIAAFEYAAFELWSSLGVSPSVVVGHSLGEFVAAHVAGVLELDDMLRLVAERARLMQALPGDGIMVSLPLPPDAVEPAVERLSRQGRAISIAAFNGPASVVVSGERAAVEELLGALGSLAEQRRFLAVSHAFHSPLMVPMLDGFERAVARVKLQPPRIPIVSSVTGEGEELAMTRPRYWAEQILRPVRFHSALASLIASGQRTFVELGPQPHLSAIGRQGFDAPSLRWLATAVLGDDEGRSPLASLAALYTLGVEIDWAALARREGSVGRRVVLPSYPWQRRRHWVEVAAGARPEPRAVEPRVAEPLPPSATGLALRWEACARPDAPPRPRSWIVVGPQSLAEPLAAALPGSAIVVPDVLPDDAAVAALGGDASSARDRGLLILTALDERLAGAEVEALPSAALRWTRVALASPHVSRLVFVTAAAQDPAADTGSSSASVRPAAATLWGLGRSIAQERPELGTLLVDLDPATPGEHVGSLLSCLALADHHDETELGVRAGRLYRARLEARALPMSPSTASGPNPGGLYVITGGLGGIGLHLARWLGRRGAGAVVLCGRRTLDGDGRRTLEELIAAGVPASYRSVDVGDAAAVSALFEELRRGPEPLAGVFHLAGVLADGPIETLDDGAIAQVFAAKVRGAINLDLAAKEVEHFVCFSSLAGLVGSPGQAPYAAANAFLDALCLDRRRRGLSAVSIAWGAWRGTGMATRIGAFNEARLQSMGVDALAPEQALAALDAILAQAPAQLGVAAVDWERFAHAWDGAASIPRLYADLVARRGRAVPGRLEQSPKAARGPIDLPALVRREIAAIAGLDAARVPMHQPLHSIGFDSLMHVELRARLQAAVDAPIPLSLLLSQPSADTLTRALAGLLPAEALPAPAADDQGPVDPPETREQAPSLGALEPPPPARPRPRGEIVVDLRAGGEEAPFFCVHPWLGTVFPYVELAQHMRGRPFCALQSVGLHAPPDLSIEAMATRYRYAIRKRQPRGPIYLGGWSLGGPVAFELACQLRELGEPVAALVMIDATSPGQPLAPSLWAASKFMVKVAAPDLWPFVLDYFRLAQSRGASRAESLSPMTVVREFASLTQRDSASRRIVETFAANSKALLQFKPRAYDGPLTVLRTRGAFLEGQDPSLGWGALMANPNHLVVRELEGNHFTILRQPHVHQLAALLDELLCG